MQLAEVQTSVCFICYTVYCRTTRSATDPQVHNK